MQKRMLVLFSALLFTSLCAFGQTDLELQIEGSTGTYSYVGGDAALVGSGIVVTVIDPQGTPYNSAVSPQIVGGTLSFQTGVNTGGWSWGNGGELTLTGCAQGVTGSGGGGACVAGDTATVLFSDSFSSASITPIAGGLGIELGGITGTLNTNLASFYGISTTVNSASESDLLSGLPASSGSAFTSGVTSAASGGNLYLDPPPPTPEPGTAILWLTGIVLMMVGRKGIAQLRRPDEETCLGKVAAA
jgi:hypothetical protein